MAKPIGKINSITIAVSDMNRSVRFYRDVLGFAVDYKSPGWSEMRAGNFYIGMYHDQPAQTAGGPLPVFVVTNILKTAAELKKKKVKFIELPYEEDYGWIAVFADPDGYQYELFQEK